MNNYDNDNQQCAFEKCKYGLAFFKSTRWGLLDFNDSLTETIKNRDDFIINNKIKKVLNVTKYTKYHTDYIKNIKNKYKGFIENLEIYQDENKNFVILTSPYTKDINIPKCYEEIENMYTQHTKTYMIKLSKDEIVNYNKQVKLIN